MSLKEIESAPALFLRCASDSFSLTRNTLAQSSCQRRRFGFILECRSAFLRKQRSASPESSRESKLWGRLEGAALYASRVAHVLVQRRWLGRTRATRYGSPAALAIEAGFVATSGGSSDRTSRILKSAESIAQRINSFHALGLCSLTSGVCAAYDGDWRKCRDNVQESERILLEHCTGTAWELTTARLYHVLALFYTGEIGQLTRRVRDFLKEAQERGNLYGATLFRTGLANTSWLAAGDVDGARRPVSEALEQWSRQGFHIEHYLAMQAQGHIDLYVGEPVEGYERIISLWPTLQQSLLLRLRNVRVAMLHLRARLALAAGNAANRPDLLREANDLSRRLEKEDLTWCKALSALLRAGIESHADEAKAAIPLLEMAAGGFEKCGMKLYAATARLRLSLILGAHVESLEACQVIRQEGITAPGRFTDMLAPGFGQS